MNFEFKSPNYTLKSSFEVVATWTQIKIHKTKSKKNCRIRKRVIKIQNCKASKKISEERNEKYKFLAASCMVTNNP